MVARVGVRGPRLLDIWVILYIIYVYIIIQLAFPQIDVSDPKERCWVGDPITYRAYRSIRQREPWEPLIVRGHQR